MIEPEQIRMAKAALNWSNSDLAKATGLHKNTLNSAERGKATKATLALIKVTLEQYVIFLPENGGGPGVRLKNPTNERK